MQVDNPQHWRGFRPSPQILTNRYSPTATPLAEHLHKKKTHDENIFRCP
jgi:hypothetical protein